MKLQNKNLLYSILAALLITPLAACAGMDGKHDMSERANAKIIYLPNGKIIVKDGDGKVIPPTPVKYPLDVKQIENITTSTSVTIRGSHYMLYCFGGACYKIPLPH